jgi:hypothetical protein
MVHQVGFITRIHALHDYLLYVFCAAPVTSCMRTQLTRQTKYVKRNIETRSRNHCCSGKAISIKRYDCVSVFLPLLLVVQMACIVSYCHLWPVWIYHIFPHLPHKWHDFGKQIIEYKMCVFISSTTLYEIFLTSEDFSEILS